MHADQHIAAINEISEKPTKTLLDRIAKSAVESVKDIERVRVGDLSINDGEDMERILNQFPMAVTTNTLTNGLAAYEAVFFSNAKQYVKELLSHVNDEGGVHGHTGLKMISVFYLIGTPSLLSLFEIPKLLMDMTIELIKAK